MPFDDVDGHVPAHVVCHRLAWCCWRYHANSIMLTEYQGWGDKSSISDALELSLLE